MFVGYYYYPSRWDDFVDDFDTIKEAEEYVDNIQRPQYGNGRRWYQIVDVRTKEVVKDGDIRYRDNKE